MRNIRTLAVALAASVALVVPLAAGGAADAASPTPGSYSALATGRPRHHGGGDPGGRRRFRGVRSLHPDGHGDGVGQLLPTCSSSQSATAAQPG